MERNSKVFFFRFNCGGMWGLGHLYRNLLLIQKMSERGNKCIAIINDFNVAKKVLSENQILYYVVNEYETPEEVLSIVDQYENETNDKILFFDRLNSNKEYINRILSCGYKILCFDDYDSSALLATEVINTRKVLINGSKIPLCGPQYQILRDDIVKFAKMKKYINENVQKVLVHFGGTDPLNILSLAFEAIKDLTCIEFILIDGKGVSNESIKTVADNMKNIFYYQTSPQFCQMLYEADIAIISGGVTMFETAAIGTPMILINHNEDQNMAANIFKQNAGVVNLGVGNTVTVEEIKKSLSNLISDYNKRQVMSYRLKTFVDAEGTERVCKCLENI